MSRTTRFSLGWCPDIPDLRDYTLACAPRDPLPDRVNLCEVQLDPKLPRIDDYHASCAIAVQFLVGWQARKWAGEPIDLSALFLHLMTIRMHGGGGQMGVSLRSTLKTLMRVGAPPESLCPSTEESHTIPQRPELFCFADQYRRLVYVRLDYVSHNAASNIAAMRRWLSAGHPFALGFTVPAHADESTPSSFTTRRTGIAGGSRVSYLAMTITTRSHTWTSGAGRKTPIEGHLSSEHAGRTAIRGFPTPTFTMDSPVMLGGSHKRIGYVRVKYGSNDRNLPLLASRSPWLP